MVEKVPQGYKKTEVGLIPKDWEVCLVKELLKENQLIDHMDGNHGELYPRNDEFKSSGVPYVGATDFNNGIVDFSKCKYLSFERAMKFKKGIAVNGDVLFAHNATVGPVALLESKFDFIILSTTATYFRCNKNKISSGYLKAFFESEYFVSQYKPVMSQSTRNQVPITAQRKFGVVLPPIDEQTAIANTLYDVDSLINSVEKLIAKKQRIKHGIIQEFLTGKRRLHGFSDEWNVKTVNEIAYISTGDKNTDDRASTGIYPFFVRSQKVERINTYSYDGEAILTAGDGVGVGKVFHYVNGKFDFHQRVYKISDFKGILGRFFFEWFKESFLAEVSKYTAKSSVDSIRREMIAGMVISYPSLEEQTAIAQILGDMDEEIEKLTAKLNKYKSIKKGMMQELLSGKRRLV